jgi:hypothetical protein
MKRLEGFGAREKVCVAQFPSECPSSCLVFSHFVLFLFLIPEVKTAAYVLVERAKCLMLPLKVKHWHPGASSVGRPICSLWREELLLDKLFSNALELVIFESPLATFTRFEGNMS